MSNDIMSLMQELEDNSAPVSATREEQIFQALESDGILYKLHGRYPPTARDMARRGVLKLNKDLKSC